MEKYRADWDNKKTSVEISQLLSSVNASIYSDHEQQERIGGMLKRIPENLRSREQENMARLYEAF